MRATMIQTKHDVHGLFVPDAVMPAQWLAHHTANTLSPERRLMLAVLEDAVADFQKTARVAHPRARQQHEEARAWLFSDDRRWLFAVRNVCDALALDVTYLRRGLVAWKARALAAPPPAAA